MLDPAAGRGEFLNSISATERWAVDEVDYDQADHYARNEVALRRAGISSWNEWQIVDDVWRPWQTRAPWVR